MKKEQFLKIPDEIIEVLIQAPCKLCSGESDIFGVFYPDDPDQWNGYVTILYPMCKKCLELDVSTDQIETILAGELAVANSCGSRYPFVGYKTYENRA